jgi:hypothetical protein
MRRWITSFYIVGWLDIFGTLSSSLLGSIGCFCLLYQICCLVGGIGLERDPRVFGI